LKKNFNVSFVFDTFSLLYTKKIKKSTQILLFFKKYAMISTETQQLRKQHVLFSFGGLK